MCVCVCVTLCHIGTRDATDTLSCDYVSPQLLSLCKGCTEIKQVNICSFRQGCLIYSFILRVCPPACVRACLSGWSIGCHCLAAFPPLKDRINSNKYISKATNSSISDQLHEAQSAVKTRQTKKPAASSKSLGRAGEGGRPKYQIHD